MESPTATHSEAQIDVWIVEDHTDFRNTMAYVIDNEPNMTCSKAFTDYESVKRLIERNGGWQVPDVVLMDYGLPGLNGIHGLRHFKDHVPQVPVIMLTIQDDEEIIYSALRAGASGYLTKNSPLDKIIDAVQLGYQGGMLMPPGVARKMLKFFQEMQPRTPVTDYGLTRREKEILNLIGEGLAHKQIAHKLFLSYHTVDTHVRNVYRKLHVTSGIEAVSKAYREGLI